MIPQNYEYLPPIQFQNSLSINLLNLNPNKLRYSQKIHIFAIKRGQSIKSALRTHRNDGEKTRKRIPNRRFSSVNFMVHRPFVNQEFPPTPTLWVVGWKGLKGSVSEGDKRKYNILLSCHRNSVSSHLSGDII